jgi:hypothetical protein
MATSGSLTTSKYDGRYYKLAWERTSYSTANNTSTIKWTLSAHGGNSSWYAERTLTAVVAGVTVKSKTSSVNRYTGEIDSGTLTIKHDSDGSKSFTASVKAAVYYSSVNCTGSKTFTLNTIPRESTISATNAYVENQSTITVNRKVSSYTHTITWACGSASGTVATKSSSTSIKWTLPTSIYAQIGSTAKSKTVTLTCKTYNSSGTQVGDSKTCTLTANTSASRNGPTLSPTITTYAKTQELTGNSTTLIAGVSEAAIVFNAAAQDSATLSSKKVTNSGKYRTTDGDFSNCTSGEFVFTATDSRGYTTTVTKKLTVINYIKPTITLKVNIGVDGKATISASGKFFSGSFGAKTNALNIQFRYKEVGGSYGSWTNFATASPGINTWSASHTLNLDYSKSYTFEAHATDIAGYGANSGEKTVRAYPVWDWGEKNMHVHGDLRIDNNYCLTGKKTDGSKFNIAHVNGNDEVVFGGGSYPPTNMTMAVNAGGNVKVGTGAGYYSILGAAKAMSVAYDISCTTPTAGSNWESCTASATLVGNCLRLGVGATRKTAAGTGNIDNETVMTFKLNHGGKIKDVFRVSGVTGNTGGTASFEFQCSNVTSTQATITVVLCATTNALKQFVAYPNLPAQLNLDAYIE